MPVGRTPGPDEIGAVERVHAKIGINHKRFV